MNLLPEQYVERSKNKARGSRVAVSIIATLCVVAAFATHSRVAINGAVKKLVKTQVQANSALELEFDASSLELQKENLDSFIQRYQNEEVLFPMGDLIATLANLLPSEMTLEELALDVVNNESGHGISGRLSGFGLSDDTIAVFVSSLQTKEPFRSVSMDFSKSRTVRNQRARGFRISFHIDLERPWSIAENIALVGGAE